MDLNAIYGKFCFIFCGIEEDAPELSTSNTASCGSSSSSTDGFDRNYFLDRRTYEQLMGVQQLSKHQAQGKPSAFAQYGAVTRPEADAPPSYTASTF